MAIKGKVCIELHNTITGEDRKIEGDNMVTNALAEYLDDLHIIRFTQNSNFNYNPFLAQLPIAPKLLGGLLIFSDTLEEDATKYTIPNSKKILGYASDDSDNETISRGSYNPEESGAISTGYKHVWDFGTSQCNGTIKALSLTHRETTEDMVNSYGFYGATDVAPDLGVFVAVDTATRKGVLLYKNDYVYYAYVSSSTAIKIYRVKVKLHDFKVNDYILGQTTTTNPPELVATITASGLSSSNVYYSTDGKDYAYAIYGGAGVGVQNLIKISLSDFTYTSRTITFPASMAAGIYVSADGKAFGMKANSGSSDTMYIYDLSTDTVVTVTLPEAISTNYFGLTEYGLAYAYKSTSKGWLVYPDGTLIYLKNIPSSSSYMRPYFPMKAGSLLMGTNNGNNYSIDIVLSNKYLGTIFNLSSAITKTAADTMKIIYTLTDA